MGVEMSSVTHINAGNLPVTYSDWELAQDTFDEHDALWCHGFGISVDLHRPTHVYTTPDGREHPVVGNLSIRLSTTTKKQANMLKLKYGSSLMLTHETTVLPNSMSVCTLSR